MNDKKDNQKKNEEKTQKEKNELNKELRQTFPASDPPSRTRPGHEKDKKEEKD
ncbi:MAG: hypothetical protein U5K72_09030 [Balneolaceae bacterium]|nr:hypothetical protein [Balneolaceae bacterium]